MLISPGFRSPEQAEFAAILGKHIETQDAPLMLEGGTGIGKTRAYTPGKGFTSGSFTQRLYTVRNAGRVCSLPLSAYQDKKS